MRETSDWWCSMPAIPGRRPRALAEAVDCVVSMNRTITDWAAIKFAASFYGALAFGRSVQKAFDQGVAQTEGGRDRRGGDARVVGPRGDRCLPRGAGGLRSREAHSPGCGGAVPRALPAERGFRGPGRRAGAAARQSLGSWPGGHPSGGPDRHGRHRQDPARCRVCPPPPDRLSRRHFLDRRGR